MDYDAEQDEIRLQQTIVMLWPLGWLPVGRWRFFKGGRVYDLSAADLNQLDRIERDGLFLAG